MSLAVNGSQNYAAGPEAKASLPGTGSGQSGSDISNLFITLLVAQIQNQDPLNPTDGTEYVTQLSQLAQVQSMEQMSNIMQSNAVLLDNLQVLSTAGLVGQQVMVQTDKIELTDQVVDGRLTLLENAKKVTLHLKDDSGKVHKIELGTQDKGSVPFSIDPEELGLEPGKYELSVVTDTHEKKVPIEISGSVNNVRIPLEGGAAVVNVSGLGEIPFYQISQFGQDQSKPDNNKRI